MRYPARQPRPAAGGGFTLIELVLILVILAILSAIAVPSLRGFGIGRQNANGATLILALANYARVQSATEGRAYRINFDPSGPAVWLTADGGGAFVPPADPDYGQRFQLAEGVQMSVDVNPQPATTLTPAADEQQAATVEPAPLFGPVVNPTPNTLAVNQHAGGTPYVTVQPNGRVDPVHVRLTDKLGGVVDVGSATATESVHVLTAEEMR